MSRRAFPRTRSAAIMATRPIRLLRCRLLTVSAVLLVTAHPSAHGKEFKDALRAQWQGAWVVLAVEAHSGCGKHYRNNIVSGTQVTSPGGVGLGATLGIGSALKEAMGFAPGELAKIDRVRVKRARVDLLLTLIVKKLIPCKVGPFTLYEERECKVEMRVDVPRALTKGRDSVEVDRMLEQVARRFDSEQEARNSELWNRREREPYPADYELTLARYAAWRAEQVDDDSGGAGDDC